MAHPHLIYFADPMCSWCWGFSPVITDIERRHGEDLPIRLVLGGLRPGTTQAMAESDKSSIRAHWEHVHQASGQPFDFAFFQRDGFVYDTEPACRAVVVIRKRSMTDALAALRRIHRAFYAQNRDVTEADTLADLAAELGWSREEFLADFASAWAITETQQDFALTQQAGVSGFPTLIAGNDTDQSHVLITHGFQRADLVEATLDKWLVSLE